MMSWAARAIDHRSLSAYAWSLVGGLVFGKNVAGSVKYVGRRGKELV